MCIQFWQQNNTNKQTLIGSRVKAQAEIHTIDVAVKYLLNDEKINDQRQLRLLLL